MKTLLRIIISVALALLPLQAWAASGATTVGVLDGGGTSRTVNVYSTTGAVTGNLSWMNTVCDFTTLTQCQAINSSGQASVLEANSAAILSAVQGSIPAGSAIIGQVSINQTTPGTTNAVQANVASGGIASGAIASGAVASGAYASGAFASGAAASGSWADGSVVTLGAKADAKSSATDTTAITAMQVFKEISYMAQNPAALPADQSVNTAQVNGVTVLTGTGATGTGAQRVTVSTDQATNAGAALVKGGVGVVNGGSYYVTVAASQTAQVLQSSSGAAGDYLSHCVVQPTATSAGTVIIYDNATTVFTFTTGTLSNLVPFTIPVGAVSTSGAWKVTTGASETVTCVGKFS